LTNKAFVENMEHLKEGGYRNLLLQGEVKKIITTHRNVCIQETGLLKPVSNLFFLEGRVW